MSTRILWRCLNLLITSTMVGNEVGGAGAVQPALARLPLAPQIQAQQALIRRYLWVMPAWLSASLGSYVPVLRETRRRGGWPFWSTLASLGCLIAMLGVTFACNLPLDRRMLGCDSSTPPDRWQALRWRWNRWQAVRNALNLLALVLLYAGLLVEARSERRSTSVG
jgi:uncharacterized membrane protein